jgi:hypothetical protein
VRQLICVAVCKATGCPFNESHDTTVDAATQPACTIPAEKMLSMLLAVTLKGAAPATSAP